MRSKKIVFSSLLTILLLLSSMAGLVPSHRLIASAQSFKLIPKKISEDLLGTISKDPNKKLKVIIQTYAAPSRAFASSVSSSGGDVKKSYRNLNAVAVEMPAKAIEALTSRKDIKFASIDAATRVAGHLEATTGA